MKIFLLVLVFLELSACAHVAAQGRIGGTRVRRTSNSSTTVWVDGQPKVRVDQSGASTSESIDTGLGLEGSGIKLRLK